MTRNPHSRQAQALAALTAAVLQANINGLASLRPVIAGAYGVYSVQTPYLDGPAAEVRQGKHVADAAHAAGVQHLVYGSAGIGKPGTGIPSWETKRQIEAHMRGLGLPLTILRPTAFMELMTDKRFFPAVTTWHLMPSLIGSSRAVPWLCTDDLRAIAATVFANPDRFVGHELNLASDRQSIDECLVIYRKVMSKNPPRFPMPIWMFERLGSVGKDLSRMYRWLGTAAIDVEPEATRAIYPGALSVEAWLRQQQTLELA